MDGARERHLEIIQTPDHIIELCYLISLCQLTPKVARSFHCEGQNPSVPDESDGRVSKMIQWIKVLFTQVR